MHSCAQWKVIIRLKKNFYLIYSMPSEEANCFWSLWYICWCSVTFLFSSEGVPSTVASQSERPLSATVAKHTGEDAYLSISLTCAFFMPTEVHSLSRVLTHSVPCCDPGNVIQMPCVTGLIALVWEEGIWPTSTVAEKAFCMKTEIPPQPNG